MEPRDVSTTGDAASRGDAAPGDAMFPVVALPLRERRLPTTFWIGLILVVGFGVFCGWLMLTVADDRQAISDRVGWLMRAQEIEQRARHVAADDDAARASVEADIAGLAKLVPAKLATGLASADGATNDQLGRIDRFVREVRRDNGIISTRLGARWDLLGVVVAVSLVLALATLVMGVLIDRRRRYADEWRRRLGEALVAMDAAKKRAEQADRMKTRFIANVSHEIRTPLNGVVGTAELFEREPLTPDQRDRIAIIRASGQTLTRIVDDLLDLARIEAGELAMREASFDVVHAIEETIALARPLASERDLTLGFVAAPDAPRHVVGDATRVRQVVSNLVGNAIKFTARGGVTVRLAPAEVGPGIRIAIEDTGRGIPTAELDSLFRAFARGAPQGGEPPGGAGLGLAICKELVGRMGGTIAVATEVGRGSTFVATLPLLPGAPPAAVPAPRAGDTPPADTIAPTPDKRVLVAEDHPINRMIIGAMLDRLGFAHDLVEDGRQAVERASTGSYGAILMDCAMPVLDGYDATREIRALVATRLPIIALTAAATDEDRQRCLDAGMDDHLTKPLTVDDLRATLARWV